MIVFALLVIAVCVGVILLAGEKLLREDEELPYAFLEEDESSDWLWPERDVEVSRWESR